MTFERSSARAVDNTAPDTAAPDATAAHTSPTRTIPTGSIAAGTAATGTAAALLRTGLSRRRVLHGAAGLGVLGVTASALAACGGDDPVETIPAATTGGLPATADVPVGGGVVVKGDTPVVVTQPTEGDFKAFTAICTHQGCTVGTVTDNVITCPCHNSMFSAETGEVVEGPAEEALAAVEIVVEGDQIMLA